MRSHRTGARLGIVGQEPIGAVDHRRLGGRRGRAGSPPPAENGERDSSPFRLPCWLLDLRLLAVDFRLRESTLAWSVAGFPPRLFTVPVQTTILVFWPMFYGMTTIAFAWLWLAWMIMRPCGIGVHSWPALTLAANLAFFQAICWTLVRSPFFRITIAVLVLPLVTLRATSLAVLSGYKFMPDGIVLNSALLIAAAYFVAVLGVMYDRCGDRLNLARRWETVARRWTGLLERRRPFASPAVAQRWLEERRHAWLMLMFLVFLGAVSSIFWTSPAFRGSDVSNAAIPIIILPSSVALFLGFGMGKTSFWARELRLSSFAATRPVTSEAMAAAKLDVAGLMRGSDVAVFHAAGVCNTGGFREVTRGREGMRRPIPRSSRMEALPAGHARPGRTARFDLVSIRCRNMPEYQWPGVAPQRRRPGRCRGGRVPRFDRILAQRFGRSGFAPIRGLSGDLSILDRALVGHRRSVDSVEAGHTRRPSCASPGTAERNPSCSRGWWWLFALCSLMTV